MVTHPFGVETLTAGTNPPRLIDFTRDIGRTSLASDSPSTATWGPFLRFATGATPPQPGTIGNPAAQPDRHRQRLRHEHLQVRGPGSSRRRRPDEPVQHGHSESDCPGAGDGYLDAGEQCDDGNVLDGDCCSATCRLEPNGSPCQDGDACTTGDTCSTGTCIGGPPPNCNDGNECTVDSCDHTLGCQNLAKPNDTPLRRRPAPHLLAARPLPGGRLLAGWGRRHG